jgi:hypothetical protein
MQDWAGATEPLLRLRRDKIIRNGEHIHWYNQSELFRLPQNSVFSPYSLIFFAILTY